VELTHSFTVPASVEDTWAAFQDIESVAGCFPGATVTEVDGEDFKGTCKVKLGPIALVYSGSGTFEEKDESAHRFVVVAKGKDKRGNGTAGATVTATMSAAGADSTEVNVLTDLAITGKPAQFGRGVIQDVSDKLLQQFVTCLQSKVGSSPGQDTGAAAGEVAAEETVTQFEPSSESTPSAASAPSGSASSGPAAAGSGGMPDELGADISGGGAVGARKAAATTYSGVSAGAEPDDSLDLGATVLPVLAKAYWRQLVAGAGALLVLYLLRRRRR
jgi:carbon monoxide dehydrogenase subunit G